MVEIFPSLYNYKLILDSVCCLVQFLEGWICNSMSSDVDYNVYVENVDYTVEKKLNARETEKSEKRGMRKIILKIESS